MKFICVVILLLCLSHCVGIKCYQCSDSGDGANADCLRGVLGLSAQRGHFERSNTTDVRRFPYLKECDHYKDRSTGRPIYRFCKIERIDSGVNLRGYIRDCSDGQDFWADSVIQRLSFSKNYVRPDNQSTCGYSHSQCENICVQICDTDFCNGPTAGQTLLHAHLSVIYLIFTFAVYAFFL